MQVGTTKDQGLYNKPSAAVHPGALAARTLSQYSTTILYSHRTNKLVLMKHNETDGACETHGKDDVWAHSFLRNT